MTHMVPLDSLRPRDRDISQSRSMDPWDSWEKSLPLRQRVLPTKGMEGCFSLWKII